ncbi:MAG: alpha/beta family hydrolase [Actinomycetota bacterium]
MSIPAGLLLTHGAGGGADHRLLVALEEQLDLPVRRMEFPYRAEGRKAPDRAPKLVASVVDEAARFVDELGCEPAELAFGGRSMGGRICSMAIAEGLPAAAVVLLSYPLHPPGKPERLRVEHFPDLAVPALFVNGDRDPFGTPDELAEHTLAIAGPVNVHWLEGQRHDPKPTFDDEIVEVVGRFLSGL